MALAERSGEGAGRTSGWYGLFGLSSDPFGEASGDYYYGSRYGVESLRLEQALERTRGVIVISGPAGTGKSALLSSVLARVATTAVATVSAADRTPATVIEALLGDHDPALADLGSTPRRAALLAILHKARAGGRPVVCVVEDAHLAKPGQLRELLGALEVTAEAQGVVQLVLVGRPPLNETLQSAALKPLKARITARIETTKLSAGEVAEFIMDRLELAGSTTAAGIFPPATIAAIHRLTGGVIGTIAPLVRASLIRATESGSFSVAPEHVTDAAQRCASLELPSRARLLARLGPLRTWTTSGSAAGLVALALVVAGAQVSMISGPPTPVEASLGAIPEFSRQGRGEPSEPATRAPTDADAALGQLAQLRSPREEFLEGTPYEVEIAPPPRPGTEPADAGESIVETPLPGTAAQQGIYRVPSWQTDPSVGAGGTPRIVEPVAPPSQQQMNPAPPMQATPLATPAPVGPYVALQVGAFREMRSATTLKKKLSKSFADVYVSPVDSGGEPLYRVRVGRFRTPEETLPLKQRLQAMGYPSFRVSQP